MHRMLRGVHVEQSLTGPVANDRGPALVMAEVLPVRVHDEPIRFRADHEDKVPLGLGAQAKYRSLFERRLGEKLWKRSANDGVWRKRKHRQPVERQTHGTLA